MQYYLQSQCNHNAFDIFANCDISTFHVQWVSVLSRLIMFTDRCSKWGDDTKGTLVGLPV